MCCFLVPTSMKICDIIYNVEGGILRYVFHSSQGTFTKSKALNACKKIAQLFPQTLWISDMFKGNFFVPFPTTGHKKFVVPWLLPTSLWLYCAAQLIKYSFLLMPFFHCFSRLTFFLTCSVSSCFADVWVKGKEDEWINTRCIHHWTAF